MSDPGIALYDPDGWREWWGSLHDSETCDPLLAVFAKGCLEDPRLAEGVGSKILEVDDGDGRVDVEIKYALKDYPKGRVFHVLSIRSDGDPLPPPVMDPVE